MVNEQEQHMDLLQRLARAGYSVTEQRSDSEGIVHVLVGKQWMTFAEMTALASQDSEQQAKD